MHLKVVSAAHMPLSDMTKTTFATVEQFRQLDEAFVASTLPSNTIFFVESVCFDATGWDTTRVTDAWFCSEKVKQELIHVYNSRCWTSFLPQTFRMKHVTITTQYNYYL